MIVGINHIAISTRDIDRLTRFYETIGFERVWTGGWDQDDLIDSVIGLQGSVAKEVILRAGNIYMEIFEYVSPRSSRGDEPMHPNDRGYTHFCFEVTDIDFEYERLTKLGMTFNREPPNMRGGQLRAIYGRDPDGNIIELLEILSNERPFRLADIPKSA
jgi:catechol 2,3-dioxygenase-like lactoylglutathione lyase family enzyme